MVRLLICLKYHILMVLLLYFILESNIICCYSLQCHQFLVCFLEYITFNHLKDIVYQILFIHSIALVPQTFTQFYHLIYIVYIFYDIELCDMFSIEDRM